MKLRSYSDLFFPLSLSVSSPGAVCVFTSAPYSTTKSPHMLLHTYIREDLEGARAGARTPSPSPHTATLLLSPVCFSSVQSSTRKWSVANTPTPSNQHSTVSLHQGQMRFVRVPDTLGGDAACLVSWVTGVTGPCWTRHLLYCNHTDTFPTANDMSTERRTEPRWRNRACSELRGSQA